MLDWCEEHGFRIRFHNGREEVMGWSHKRSIYARLKAWSILSVMIPHNVGVMS